jgi:hypothetical protein
MKKIDLNLANNPLNKAQNSDKEDNVTELSQKLSLTQRRKESFKMLMM